MPSWVVAREGSRLRWGGDLRRHYILSALARVPGAVDVDGWSVGALRPVLSAAGATGALPGADRPLVAAATLLPDPALELVRERGTPALVDIHDDPVAQTRALGLTPDPAWVDATLARRRHNAELFRLAIVPSIGIARIAELDPARIIVAGNGTDPSLVRERPWPDAPAIGMCAGAAPGRGIEALIAAARLLRGSAGLADLRLRLWLAGTGADSEAYLAALRESVAADPWIEILSRGYVEVAAELGSVTVHCIPTPAADYWDLVSPIKLWDAMASARPVVVTPRGEMAADVRRYDAGVVTRGDDAESIAEALAAVLGDETAARAMGARGRRAAVEHHDWRHIADEVAAAALAAFDGASHPGMSGR